MPRCLISTSRSSRHCASGSAHGRVSSPAAWSAGGVKTNRTEPVSQPGRDGELVVPPNATAAPVAQPGRDGELVVPPNATAAPVAQPGRDGDVVVPPNATAASVAQPGWDGDMLLPLSTTATFSPGAGLYPPLSRAAIPTQAAGSAAILNARHSARRAARIEASSTSNTSST